MYNGLDLKGRTFKNTLPYAAADDLKGGTWDVVKKASEMKPTPIPHCMGGEGTVMMERLLDAPAEMLGKGRAYVRHTLAPGVTIGRHTHEHEMESMVIVSGRAVHIINGEEQILEKGDIIAAMPGDTHQIACLGDEPLVLIAQVLYE